MDLHLVKILRKRRRFIVEVENLVDDFLFRVCACACVFVSWPRHHHAGRVLWFAQVSICLGVSKSFPGLTG
jgi:hypothetical protein